MRSLLSLAVALLVALGTPFARAQADHWTPIEKQVADVAAGPSVTIVHFWAPWSPNCMNEIRNMGWRDFLSVNRDVNVIFVTVWSDDDGKAELAKQGIGEQPNFLLLHHPNTARGETERMNSFFNHPVEWIPATWVFKDGHLRYALDYGEVRFPLLQQLVRDAAHGWEASGTKPASELK